VRLALNTRVGPYEVLALLGSGGMAEVYRARDTRLGRDVALKVMSEALSADVALLERFEREAKLAGALNHPNVVALYDVGLEDGKAYFVTELLQGESLRERLSKGTIPLAVALDWAAQMAHGLAAAHQRGIIHRDLKPENVFLTRDGHVKLIDFGIAKLVEAVREVDSHGIMDSTLSPSGSRTGTGAVLGTPGYMSPEQVRGDQVDARTDFFSFGAVLHEMLGGARAFPATSFVESGYAILHREPEPLPAAVPLAVAQVVQRCLEKDPGRRFHSARDLAFHLDSLQSPTPMATPATAPGMPPIRPRRRPRWLVPVAGTIAAIALAALTYFLGRQSRPPMPEVDLVTFRWGRVSAGRFNPEGRVVFSAAWGGRPLEVFVRPPGSNEAQPLGVGDAALLGVSRTGEIAVLLHPRLVEGVERGTLAIAPAAGGAARELAEDVEYADWSPAGELAVVRAVGGKRQLEFPLGTPIHESAGWLVNPRVSPRGDAVAVLESGLNVPQEVILVDRRGTVRVLASLAGRGGGTGLAWTPGGDEVWASTNNALWASRPGASWRLVYQGVYEMRLEDISGTGAVMVDAQDSRRDLVFSPQDGQRQRLLSWSDRSELGALSDDGRRVLYTAYSNGRLSAFIGPTDGSPPLKLGSGHALALSRDGAWVLARPEDYRESLSLLPVGPGNARALPVTGLDVADASWLRDGSAVVFAARSVQGKQHTLYRAGLDDGAPRRISETPVNPFQVSVSSDDQLVAARELDEVLTLFPLGGGPPVRLPELGKGASPVGWAAKDQLWLRTRDVPSRLLRYDIRNRRTLEERSVAPGELTGVSRIPNIQITPDGRHVAFDVERTLSYLYVLEGLSPRR
jgi:eukaryotic-like serine/threonine-protein kinase